MSDVGPFRDAIRALTVLAPSDEDTKQQIARMLGLDRGPGVKLNALTESSNEALGLPHLSRRSWSTVGRGELLGTIPNPGQPDTSTQLTTVTQLERKADRAFASVGFCLPRETSRFDWRQDRILELQDRLYGALNAKWGPTGSFDVGVREEKAPESVLSTVQNSNVVILILTEEGLKSGGMAEVFSRALNQTISSAAFRFIAVLVGSYSTDELSPGVKVIEVTESSTSDSVIEEVLQSILRPKEAVWLTAEPLTIYGSESAPLPIEPLIRKGWTRGILYESAARSMQTREIDVPSAIESIANGDSFGKVPFLKRRSLRNGAQVLIDSGPGMHPYRFDQEEIKEELNRLLPGQSMQLLYFSSSPLRGCFGPPSWDDQDYAFPHSGTPILVFTDLGIGGAGIEPSIAGPSEWKEFMVLARTAMCPVVAFVPYGPERWPRTLCKLASLITWDRTTTASTVRKAKVAVP